MSSFPAKILLFGEYSILQGSGALTLPFSKYTASLAQWHDSPDVFAQDSNQKLKEYAAWLGKQAGLLKVGLQLNRLTAAVKNGLYLQSSVPANYGLGSSGALVAALLAEYLPEIQTYSLQDLKKLMAEAESYFHSTSSGIDPLSCYIQKPLYLKGEQIQVLDSVDISVFVNRFYLLDSGQPGATGEYVKQFMAGATDSKANSSFSRFTPMVDQALDLLFQNQQNQFENQLEEISQYQYENFKPMIPQPLRSVWKKGLENRQFLVKLCGSGGGGYSLVYSKLSLHELEVQLGAEVVPVRS